MTITKRTSEQLDAMPRGLYAPRDTSDDLTVYPILVDVNGRMLVAVTGSTEVLNTVAVTGSVEVLNTVAVTGSTVDPNIENAVDGATTALRTVTYEHHEVHSGSHYFVSDVSDLSINNVLDVQFQTADSVKWSHFTFNIACESETEWFIYEAVTFTVTGTTITPFNNNRNSANTSGNLVLQQSNTSLANANADTNITGSTLLLHGIVGSGRRNLGAEERSDELMLKQNTKYCFRAIANAAGYVDFDMDWYEHQNANAVFGLSILGSFGDEGYFNFTAVTSSTTFSVEMSVKFDSSQPQGNGCLFDTYGSGDDGLFYNRSTQKLNYYISGNNLNDTVLSDGVYYNVIFSVTSGTGTFYVDGVSDGTVNSVPSISIDACGSDANNRNFQGAIKDFRIYPGKSLSASEALTRSQGGVVSGATLHYNFSEGSGATLNDIIGSNDATINGNTSWVVV